ncbi:hypothetical protein [Saccharopolyspora griseoalba]|uniref:Uncharacterized protein n=1 Tax=Saccharopolyspora griseoalba TaxID=1431848 RepID=A0ABW2LH39_9PSEU
MEPTTLTDQPDPLPPVPPELRAPAGARLGVLLGVLLVISAALAGAVVLARTHDQPRPVPAAEPIAGTLALRPDLVRDARWPFRENGGFAHPDAGDVDVSGPPLDYERIANPSAGSPGTALSLVEEFYRRAASDPAGATELLAPELLDGHRERLSATWSTAEAVRLLRAGVEPDGAVRTEVEVTYPRGERVRMQQVLRVATGAVPQIVGAELRSARHLPAG